MMNGDGVEKLTLTKSTDEAMRHVRMKKISDDISGDEVII